MVTGLNVTCQESDAQYAGVKHVKQQSITKSLNNQQPFVSHENY